MATSTTATKDHRDHRGHPRRGPRPLRGRGPPAGEGACCSAEPETFGSELYSALERAELPDAAVLASLGCGNPTAVAELHEGERVLDLGSGGGIDVLLSAKRVGPTGRAIGLDMTDEMLALAQRNAAEAGATNVEFLRGHIESIPLPAASVDVVISNCVINLAADKPAVFREIARVLRPGGRMGITDIVAEDHLTLDQRAERGSYAGCIAGALSVLRVPRGPRGRRSNRRVPHADARGRRWHGERHRAGDQARGRDDRDRGGGHAGPRLDQGRAAAGELGLLRRRRLRLMGVERAVPSDVPVIEALLAAAGLPLEGVAEAFETGLVAREGAEVVGAAAMEPYGRTGLLRSVVVAEARRGTGVGREVVTAAEALARDEGIEELYLLTETAADWFPRLGLRGGGPRAGAGGRRRVDRVHDGLCHDRRPDAAAPGLTDATRLRRR